MWKVWQENSAGRETGRARLPQTLPERSVAPTGKDMRSLRTRVCPPQNVLSPAGDASAEQAELCFSGTQARLLLTPPGKHFLSAWDAHPLLFCLESSQGALAGGPRAGGTLPGVGVLLAEHHKPWTTDFTARWKRKC